MNQELNINDWINICKEKQKELEKLQKQYYLLRIEKEYLKCSVCNKITKHI